MLFLLGSLWISKVYIKENTQIYFLGVNLGVICVTTWKSSEIAEKEGKRIEPNRH